MAKKKATASSKKEVTQNDIITLYMEYALDHEHFPKSVYKFCKEVGIDESIFYKFFGSFENLQKTIWNTFSSMTLNLAHKNKEYEEYNSREKMLTFFYTFFELLTANRSYVLFALSQGQGMDKLKNLSQLKDLRKSIKEFSTALIQEDNDNKQTKITKSPIGLFSEGVWLQFIFLLNFWVKDSSIGFEKTDAAIEKSVNTIFDVFDTTPLDNVIDFGKFLWHEAVN